MHVLTATLLISAPLLAGVVAVDADERALDMLSQAIGFSPWGAAIVLIAWTAKRDIGKGLAELAALWRETLNIVKPWADRAHDLSTAIRKSSSSVETKAARRPKTNPINLPPKRQ